MIADGFDNVRNTSSAFIAYADVRIISSQFSLHEIMTTASVNTKAPFLTSDYENQWVTLDGYFVKINKQTRTKKH